MPQMQQRGKIGRDYENKRKMIYGTIMDAKPVSEKNKVQEMLNLSDEILSDLEMGNLSFENIVSECKKLARMRDDFEAIKWFTLELNGYDRKSIPLGIKEEELFGFAKRSGRNVLWTGTNSQKEELRYWTASIPELEVGITANKTKLDNLHPPETYTPAITKSADTGLFAGATFVAETYGHVIAKIRQEQDYLSQQITDSKSLLAKIRNGIYDYVLSINLQLKFENITESIFQQTKEIVDKKLDEICPEAMKKFLAAYDRLKSKNPEEWSQAMSSCRNVLKEFADYVFPARKEDYKKGNEMISMTDDKYKNRLLAFIDTKVKGKKNAFLSARVSDLESRIHSLNDLLSKGTHEGLSQSDVNMCVLDTYLLIGSLVGLID